MNNHKISIITICRNSGEVISKCIESVLGQTYPNLEYIIIDGASTDNTMAVINNYKDGITKVISEPDKGIYDAMNKGISECSGDFILFINADDYLITELTISNTMEMINSSITNKPDIFYGKVLILNKNNGEGNVWKAAKVSKYSLYRGSIPHPATIYSRDSFNRSGLFDISYKIAGDYEWVTRAYIKNNLVFRSIDAIISVFLKEESQQNEEYKNISMNEIMRIRKIYFNSAERNYFKFKWFLRKNFKV